MRKKKRYKGMTQDLKLYSSEYTATDTVSIIPINIAMYEPGIDFLIVFLNGEMINEDTDYTINLTPGTITLTEPINQGETVNFLCIKANGIDIRVSEFGSPESRNEALLQNILGGNNPIQYPFSRIEVLLLALMEKINVDASKNPNLEAALDSIKENWDSFETGISHVAPVQAAGPVAGVIVYKYNDEYGAVLVLSYHPMFPHPAYCRLFAGEWQTPYWL